MAKTLTFITGGQRSGKSSYAQGQALALTDTPIYLATARVLDEDFKKRVDIHKADREGQHWTTIEEDKKIGSIDLYGDVVVVDCITLWLTNIFLDNGGDVEKSLAEAKAEWYKLMEKRVDLIVITNEIGMGVHAENEMSRKFTDLQGWINQFIASLANHLILMVCGIPQKIK